MSIVALVVAENRQAHEIFIRRYRLNPHKYPYVYSRQKIMGMSRETPVIFYGDVLQYPEKRELVAFIRSRYFNVIEWEYDQPTPEIPKYKYGDIGPLTPKLWQKLYLQDTAPLLFKPGKIIKWEGYL